MQIKKEKMGLQPLFLSKFKINPWVFAGLNK